jgi:NAD(P)-dependent dehydrogenase (short-subunit alcohol dehydrogenase family)
VTRSIIVTGGAQGIGEAIARAASAAGYRVGVLDIDADLAHQVAGSLDDAIALPASIEDADAIEAALDVFGTPNALVNNAGIVRFGPLMEQSLDDIRSVLGVNAVGSFVCARACARRMAVAGGGSIVSITSINGMVPGPNAGAYGASKAALNIICQQMSIEWAPLGIKVNTVAPGVVDDGMSAAIHDDAGFRSRRLAQIPAGRFASGDDIANAVLFLCSPEADYITGHQLVVDGGVVNSIIASLRRPATIDGVGDAPTQIGSPER